MAAVLQGTAHRLLTVVGHRAVTRETLSSTLAGPTLRVFKQLRRKCCLCNYICKWLDSLLFSDRTINRIGPVSQPFNVHNPVGRKRTHTLVAKSRARSSRRCGLSSVVYHGW